MARNRTIYPTDAETLEKVRLELARSREKFPSNQHQLAALQEEEGELAESLIEHSLGNGGAVDVFEEAVQAAAMAIRVATEGDAAFEYDNPEDPKPCPTNIESAHSTAYGITLPENMQSGYEFERVLRALKGLAKATEDGEDFRIDRDAGGEVCIRRVHFGDTEAVVGSGSNLFLALQGTIPFLRQMGYTETGA